MTSPPGDDPRVDYGPTVDCEHCRRQWPRRFSVLTAKDGDVVNHGRWFCTVKCLDAYEAAHG